jgi:sec-independent protein translocase protein TatA
MGEFGITHWLILALVLLLLFGAKRIPEVGSSIGKGIREFKRSLSDIDGAGDEAPRGPAPPSGKSPPKRLLE